MEQLVNKETAELAKQKGFNVRVRKYYDSFDEVKIGFDATGPKEDWDYNTSFIGWCSAPTQSILQAWLRTKNIHMYTKMFHDSLENKTTYACDAFSRSSGKVKVMKSPKLETYEDALEYALNEGLNTLKNSRRFKEEEI